MLSLHERKLKDHRSVNENVSRYQSHIDFEVKEGLSTEKEIECKRNL